MPDHEPLEIGDEDTLSGEKHESRAGRASAVSPGGTDTAAAGTHSPTVPTDTTDAAGEAQTLQRLPDEVASPPPPGRQRTGDLPATP